MKKTIILTTAIMMIMMLTIFLSGCGNNSEKMKEESGENIVFKLEEVWTSKDYTIELYRDTTTNIIYLRDSDIRSGGYTVLPDPETGLPLTYDRFLEIYAVKED